MARPLVTISDRGTLSGIELALEAIPQAADRARRRALSKLKTFVESQVAKVVSAELKIPQKTVKALGRVRQTVRGDGAMSIWVGTDDIPVHRLGTVSWKRSEKGAKVNRRLYPGTWSWGKGSKTGTAVMRRVGDTRLPIESVREPIHESVSQRIQDLLPEVSERYGRLMRREMRYALREVSK